MKTKNSLKTLQLDNTTVFVRADLNVPLNNQIIGDETRIIKSIPTLQYLLNKNCTVLLSSHLGRPKGKVVSDLSLQAIATRLNKLIDEPVYFVNDCIGQSVDDMIAKHKNERCIILLENLRFHKEETDNNLDFAKKLSKHAQFYINDAFGTAHRAHASTYQIATLLPSAPGLLLEKEIEYLGGVLTAPDKPLITLLGGSKVSSKLTVLKSLLQKSDKVLLGGGMIFTFYKAQGYDIGKSLCEDDFIDNAKAILKEFPDKLILPSDVRVTTEIKKGSGTKNVAVDSIPSDAMGVDIGEETEKQYSEILKSAKTVLWNGPMGIFEIADYASGTRIVCETMANLDAKTIVGGGDSVAAATQMGFDHKMSHISTGGGASLEFLEGKVLPGIEALS
ncbi:MAG: phosphoglycerate kinase [Candidatus Cloacimonadota bacterium]|nr:MAG: phosphoglycerate kinase [Candidatus Cloacimonadota bacterium]